MVILSAVGVNNCVLGSFDMSLEGAVNAFRASCLEFGLTPEEYTPEGGVIFQFDDFAEGLWDLLLKYAPGSDVHGDPPSDYNPRELPSSGGYTQTGQYCD